MLPKIVHFIWLCHHNSIPVRGVLASRGINCCTKCPVCNDQEETIIHTLRDCNFAGIFWDKINVPPILRYTFDASMCDWFKVNCQCSIVHHSAIPWSILFPFAVWFLNLVLHKTCFSQALEYLYGVAKIKSQNLRVTIPIRWLKPPMNWLKLNTDRDSAGRWVKGFSRSIGLATNVMAKCWALRDGMQLANHLGIQNIVVELDAKIIVDILQSNQETNNSFSPLLMDCRLLLRNFPQSRVSHVFRKANFCANAMAKRGVSQVEDFVVFDNPPSNDVNSFVNSDMYGLCYGRLTTATTATLAILAS